MKSIPSSWILILFLVLGFGVWGYSQAHVDPLPTPQSPWEVLEELKKSALLELAENTTAFGQTESYHLELKRLSNIQNNENQFARYILNLSLRPKVEIFFPKFLKGIEFGMILDLSKSSDQTLRVVALRKIEDKVIR